MSRRPRATRRAPGGPARGRPAPAAGVLGALGAAAVLVAGCRAPDRPAEAALSVYAASSLTEAFTELGSVFEETHPDVRAELTFAGSQVLRVQIEQGAPADVYASADSAHMEALVREGLVRDARWFGGNELVVVVPPDNPAGIESFADLPRAERIVLGTASVPVGRYARAMLAAADSLLRPGFEAAVLAHVVSEESNVRLARSKVELGEADAAVVYRTDAVPSERVRTVPVPDEVNVRADYLVGTVVRPGAHPGEGTGRRAGGGESGGLAADWVALVTSDEGRAVLERHGFVTR